MRMVGMPVWLSTYVDYYQEAMFLSIRVVADAPGVSS